MGCSRGLGGGEGRGEGEVEGGGGIIVKALEWARRLHVSAASSLPPNNRPYQQAQAL